MLFLKLLWISWDMASGLGTESAKACYSQDRKAPVEDQMALGSEGKVDKGVAPGLPSSAPLATLLHALNPEFFSLHS